MEMEQRKKGYLLILLAAVVYSTTEVALKELAGAFAPMQLTAERVLVGGAVLLPFALRELKARGVKLTASDFRSFLGMGALTVMLHMSLLQMSLLTEDASAAAVIYSGYPVFALFVAHLLQHEPLRRSSLTALALEVLGILIILNPFELEMSLPGFLEILIATICFSVYGTLSKLRVGRIGSYAVTSFNLLIGGAELLIILLLGKLPAVAALYERCGLTLFAAVPLTTGFTLRTTLIFLYVGTVVAGVGFLLMTKITEYTSATEASFIYLLKPVLATALAAAVFHEAISLNRMVGIAFFLAASLCVSVPVLREMKRQKAAEETGRGEKA